MRLAKTSGPLALAILASLASPMAAAQDDSWYGGFNFGQTRATIDNARITSALLGGGYVTTAIVDDDRDNGFKIFGGYQWNRNFAIEAGYFDLGQFGYTATTVPAGTLTGRIKLKGVNIDLVGIIPITDKFSAFGRIGAIYAQAKDRFTTTGAVNLITDPSPSKSAANYKFGAGLQYDFSENLAVRLEGERYRVDDAIGNKGDVDMYSLGLIYRFGAEHEVAPEPVVMAPQKTCADLDDDGDGVNNCNDKCPGSSAGQAVGPDGCPIPAPEPEPVMEPKPFKG